MNIRPTFKTTLISNKNRSLLHLSFQVERQFNAAVGIAGAVLPAIAGGAAAVAVINSDQDGLAQPLTELIGDKIYYFI